MEQQTAVEWLIEKIKNFDYVADTLIKQAKEMEKQQIMDAHRHGFTEGTCFGATTIYKFISAEDYYKETFNK
jgi:hypothetical protein